jgi:transcriptional regulator with XRE-family HTH domain
MKPGLTLSYSSSVDDLHIGRRLKVARLESGFTQREVADLMGVSSQQLHKFEGGINRVTVKTLYHLSRLYDKPLDWFTQDIISGMSAGEPPAEKQDIPPDILRLLQRVEDPSKREKIIKLIRLVL